MVVEFISLVVPLLQNSEYLQAEQPKKNPVRLKFTVAAHTWSGRRYARHPANGCEVFPKHFCLHSVSDLVSVENFVWFVGHLSSILVHRLNLLLFWSFPGVRYSLRKPFPLCVHLHFAEEPHSNWLVP